MRLFRCHESSCIPEEAFTIALAAAFVLVEEACIHQGRACHSRHAWMERFSAYVLTLVATDTVWQTAPSRVITMFRGSVSLTLPE